MEGLVSIVVPVYNVERYLDRCLTSIVNQTYSNLEIILVDDGSPDQCPQKCDQWAEKDPRITVIHKKNEGLGYARNTGIKNAHGEYICFFDSDDYVELDTIRLSYELAKKETADMVVFGMKRIGKEGKIVHQKIPCTPQNVYCGEEVQEELLPQLFGRDPKTGITYGLMASACNILLSAKLIQATQFAFVSEREIISEDIYALLILYKSIQRAAVLSEALYCYCENAQSLTKTYREDRYLKNKAFYQRCVKLCCEQEYSSRVIHACVRPFLGNTIETLKQIVSMSLGYMTAKKQIKKVIDDDVLQKVLKDVENDSYSFFIRLYFKAMMHKKYTLCWIMTWTRNVIDGR